MSLGVLCHWDRYHNTNSKEWRSTLLCGDKHNASAVASLKMVCSCCIYTMKLQKLKVDELFFQLMFCSWMISTCIVTRSFWSMKLVSNSKNYTLVNHWLSRKIPVLSWKIPIRLLLCIQRAAFYAHLMLHHSTIIRINRKLVLWDSWHQTLVAWRMNLSQTFPVTDGILVSPLSLQN